MTWDSPDDLCMDDDERGARPRSGECEYCGEPGDLMPVDDNDATMNYFDTVWLCKACRERKR